MIHPNEERYQEILEKIIKLADQSFPVECAGQFNRGSIQDKDGKDQKFVGIIIVRKEDHEILASVRMYLDDGKFKVSSPAAPGVLGEQASKVQAVLNMAHFAICKDSIKTTERELIQ